MEVVRQSAAPIVGLRPLELVEYCARVCYASVDKIQPGSAKAFVKTLAARGHFTPLEHAYIHIYINEITDKAMQTYVMGLYNFAAPGDYPFADRKLTRGSFYREKDERGAYVAGNLRDVYMYLSAHDPSLDFYEEDAVQLALDHPVVEIITDRGIATEFFRHRTMSYDDSGYENGYISYSAEYVPELSVNQQSTRYVSFTKHPYAVVLPEPFTWAYDPTCMEHQAWYNTCAACFDTYKELREHNIPPEQARNVLPLSTATTVVMSGSLLNWLYVLNLRLPQGAHPQARLLACYIWEILKAGYSEQIESYVKTGKLDATYQVCDFDKFYAEMKTLIAHNKGDTPCQSTQTGASAESK